MSNHGKATSGGFGGKKAAPFKKGGGRKKKSSKNYKGEARKGKGGK